MKDLIQSGKDPWAQQSNESNADYFAFVEYCKLGVRRSTRVLAAHLGTSVTKVNRIAKAFDWDNRAWAFDKACNELHPSAEDLSIEDTLAFQEAVGKAMLDIGLTALEMKNPASMRTADIVKLLQQGSEIQRRAAGISDSVSIKVEGDAVQAINSLLDEIVGDAEEIPDE